jgi:predicted transcriptional regulator
MNKHGTSFSIALPKKEERRLKDAALRYAISPDKMARRIIADATRSLLDIPEESLDKYKNKEEIIEALEEGLRDYRRGVFLRKLPKRIRS